MDGNIEAARAKERVNGYMRYRLVGNLAVALMLPFIVHAISPRWAYIGTILSAVAVVALLAAMWRRVKQEHGW